MPSARRALLAATVLAALLAPSAPATAAWRDPAPSAPADVISLDPVVHAAYIPYSATRKAQMAAYASRHYGVSTATLRPSAIVLHFTDTDSVSSVINTFAANTPNLGEYPGVCAHFLIDQTGYIRQLVPTTLMCRHTIGLNHVAIGIEMIQSTSGHSAAWADQQILARGPQIRAALGLVRHLQGQYGIATSHIYGHGTANAAPEFRDLEGWRNDHSDWGAPAVAEFRHRLGVRANVKEVTGDGRGDLVMLTGAALQARPGNAAGSFLAARPLATRVAGERSLQPGDWDNDGRQDLLEITPAGRLLFFRGSGAGSFALAGQVSATWGYPYAASVGNAAGGWPSCLVTLRSDGQARLWVGNRAGGFRTSVALGTWPGVTAVVGPGDVTGDGAVDVLTRSTDGRLWLRRGNGAGSFAAPVLVGSGFATARLLTSVGDVTGDGRPDLLAVDQFGRLLRYTGLGGGHVASPVVLQTGLGAVTALGG